MRKQLAVFAAAMALGTSAFAQGTQQPSTPTAQPQMQRPQMQGQMGQGRMMGRQFQHKAPAQVVQQLEARVKEYERAWNQEDIQKMSSFYTKDATMLNPMGQQLTGAQEIGQAIAQEHQGPLKGSQTQLHLRAVRTITPDVAIMDLHQTLTGVQPQPGQPALDEVHATVLVRKMGQQWMVEALRAFPIPQRSGMGVGGAGQQDVPRK
jgi:uncharacterized protein (TIGR02246 family)